jgi:hypothetical protein
VSAAAFRPDKNDRPLLPKAITDQAGDATLQVLRNPRATAAFIAQVTARQEPGKS